MEGGLWGHPSVPPAFPLPEVAADNWKCVRSRSGLSRSQLLGSVCGPGWQKIPLIRHPVTAVRSRESTGVSF